MEGIKLSVLVWRNEIKSVFCSIIKCRYKKIFSKPMVFERKAYIYPAGRGADGQ